MYTVRWNDWEGNEHRYPFETLDDAECEAADLAERYDFVEILDPNDNIVEM